MDGLIVRRKSNPKNQSSYGLAPRISPFVCFFPAAGSYRYDDDEAAAARW
jgi:hypothetical protein